MGVEKGNNEEDGVVVDRNLELMDSIPFQPPQVSTKAFAFASIARCVALYYIALFAKCDKRDSIYVLSGYGNHAMRFIHNIVVIRLIIHASSWNVSLRLLSLAGTILCGMLYTLAMDATLDFVLCIRAVLGRSGSAARLRPRFSGDCGIGKEERDTSVGAGETG